MGDRERQPCMSKKTMTVLDCSSLETTLLSLVPFLCVDADGIMNRLSAPKLNPANEELVAQDILKTLLGEFPERSEGWPYTSIAWFHLTRTSDLQRYREGIKPVTDVIDQIWTELRSACDNEGIMLDWQDLRHWVETESSGHFAKLYRLKQEPGMKGPFGMLLLESAWQERPGDNHYLRCPETIEDICKEVKARTGIEIIEAYQKNTRPAVVKFLDQEPCLECAEAALYFAYGSLWNQDYHSGWNIYFDGDGSSVPASMIVSVDHIHI